MQASLGNAETEGGIRFACAVRQRLRVRMALCSGQSIASRFSVSSLVFSSWPKLRASRLCRPCQEARRIIRLVRAG